MALWDFLFCFVLFFKLSLKPTTMLFAVNCSVSKHPPASFVFHKLFDVSGNECASKGPVQPWVAEGQVAGSGSLCAISASSWDLPVTVPLTSLQPGHTSS